jgi:hypothetical protein
VTAATLSRQEFPATGGLGALLTFRAGWVGEGTDGIAVGAIGLLDVEVWRQDERLGVVARLRDLLPGRYAIGLTGRGPDGGPLAPGRYEIRFVTRPADGRDGSARTLGGPQFRVVEANAGRAAAGTALELRWGGLTYGAGGLDAFARWLGDRGASYERWRRSHSEVACDVFTDCR